MSAARWLLALISAVVVSFVLATVVTEHIEDAIGGRTQDIVSNAMPSVKWLTRALGTLDRLDNDLDQYALVPADRRSAFLDQIASDRGAIGRDLAGYEGLPRYPGETALYAAVKSDLEDLTALLDSALMHGNPVLLASVHSKLDGVQQSVQRVVEFNAEQGQRRGQEIESIRRKSRGLVILLDELSVVLAICAAIVALRQLRRSKRTLEAARKAVQQREADLTSHAEALGDFAGRVAHDIVSPLSTAQLSLDRVRQSCEADSSTCRAADRGVAAIHRVHNLVDGLLAFSRAGGHPEPGSAAELAPVIADVIDELGPQAKQQSIDLHVAAIPEAVVACSPGVLTSLISNLVRNAIRYMGDAVERCIDVRVQEAGERFRIEVRDTGPGIPLEQQKRIFEPYIQLRRGGTGIGLGLATVERLAQAHGGAVGVTSAPGHGSTFWFELPVYGSSPLMQARA